MSSIDLWYTTRATGVVTLLLLSATTFLGVLTAGRARSAAPAFARVDLHRRLSALAVVFLAIHVLTSVLDSYVHVGWLSVVVPFTSGYRPGWVALGTVSLDLFLAVGISSLLRQRISARTWRLVHWLAYLSWPVAVMHSIGMGTDMKLSWMLALVAATSALVVGAALWRLDDSVRHRSRLPETAIAPRRSLRPTVSSGRSS
ncbi:MAG: ferric reductase [Acidimicrobiaceae bacterium]|nr:ferric reductase [Acidimicrobiaceae bacterium]